MREALQAVLAAQTALRRTLTDFQWRAYLLVNERTNAMQNLFADCAIKEAFERGRSRSIRKVER